MNPKENLKSVLKDLGLTTVRMNNTCYGYSPKKIFRNSMGKTVPAIEGSSQGPMTLTDAHIRRNEELERKIYTTLQPYAMEITHSNRSIIAKFDIGNGKVRTLHFDWQLFQSYTYKADLDPSYMTNWFCLTSIDSKNK